MNRFIRARELLSLEYSLNEFRLQRSWPATANSSQTLQLETVQSFQLHEDAVQTRWRFNLVHLLTAPKPYYLWSWWIIDHFTQDKWVVLPCDPCVGPPSAFTYSASHHMGHAPPPIVWVLLYSRRQPPSTLAPTAAIYADLSSLSLPPSVFSTVGMCPFRWSLAHASLSHRGSPLRLGALPHLPRAAPVPLGVMPLCRTTRLPCPIKLEVVGPSRMAATPALSECPGPSSCTRQAHTPRCHRPQQPQISSIVNSICIALHSTTTLSNNLNWTDERGISSAWHPKSRCHND
jgi:hypothetical protein